MCRTGVLSASAAHQLHHVEKYLIGTGTVPSGTWFESTLRSSDLTPPVASESAPLGGHHHHQLYWDQTVKFVTDVDGDVTTTPELSGVDRSWTRVRNGDVMVT